MIIPTSGLGGEEQKRIHLERLNLMASFPWKTSSWLWRQGPEDEAKTPAPGGGAPCPPAPRLCMRQGSLPPHYETPSSSSNPCQSDLEGCPSWGLHNLSAFLSALQLLLNCL